MQKFAIILELNHFPHYFDSTYLFCTIGGKVEFINPHYREIGTMRGCTNRGPSVLMEKYFFNLLQLVKQFLRVTRVHKKIAWVGLAKMASGWFLAQPIPTFFIKYFISKVQNCIVLTVRSNYFKTSLNWTFINIFEHQYTFLSTKSQIKLTSIQDR